MSGLIFAAATVGGCYYILGLLLGMCAWNWQHIFERPKKIQKDEFKNLENKQGWNWDWCFVFKVHGEDFSVKDTEVGNYQKHWSVQNCAKKIKLANMECKIYKSQKFDKLFMKVRASRDRLEEIADEIDYKLLLDEGVVKMRMLNGLKSTDPDDEDFPWLIYPRRDGWYYKGIEMRTAIADTQEQCPYQWNEYIYGKYDQREDLQSMYDVKLRSNSQFRGVDRIKLMQKIFESELHENGCGMNLALLSNPKTPPDQRACLAIYPIHDYDELLPVMRRVLVYKCWPWKTPVDDIKDYYGEKIGLYFLFITHYATWLIYASFFGCLAWIATFLDDADSEAIPAFCVAMAVWGTLMLESWKQKQARHAMFWGQTGFEDEQTDRPEFKGTAVIQSPIDGGEEEYFPPDESAKRSAISQIIICGCILGVIFAVGLIFFIKIYLTTPEMQVLLALPPAGIKIPGVEPFPLGAIIASVANAVQIELFNFFYKNKIVLGLNEYENHRTQTSYEDQLIAKTFVFAFVNKFANVFFIAFIKEPLSIMFGNRQLQCVGSCLTELSTALSSVVLSQCLVKNASKVMPPYLLWKKQMLADLAKEGDDDDDGEAEGEEGEEVDPEMPVERGGEEEKAERQCSPCEEQFGLVHYDRILGPFDDYSELTIQYGYVTLLVAAFPLAPIMAFASCYLQLRVDAWRLSQTARRPWPDGAEDIGTWQSIIELISLMSVITNCALICFTSQLLQDFTTFDRCLIFVVLEHTLICAKLALAEYIDDEPGDVAMQGARNEFIGEKLISQDRDEPPDMLELIDEEEDAADVGADLMIYDQDITEIYLDYPGYEGQAPTQDDEQFFSFENSEVRYCELTPIGGSKPSAAAADEKPSFVGGVGGADNEEQGAGGLGEVDVGIDENKSDN